MLNRNFTSKAFSVDRNVDATFVFWTKPAIIWKWTPPQARGQRTSRRPEYSLLRLLINLKNDNVVLCVWLRYIYVSCSRHVECGHGGGGWG